MSKNARPNSCLLWLNISLLWPNSSFLHPNISPLRLNISPFSPAAADHLSLPTDVIKAIDIFPAFCEIFLLCRVYRRHMYGICQTFGRLKFCYCRNEKGFAIIIHGRIKARRLQTAENKMPRIYASHEFSERGAPGAGEK